MKPEIRSTLFFRKVDKSINRTEDTCFYFFSVFFEALKVLQNTNSVRGKERHTGTGQGTTVLETLMWFDN